MHKKHLTKYSIYSWFLKYSYQTEINLLASTGSQRKQDNSRKNIYFCFIDYTKAFDCVKHNKLWEILKETGIPDPLPATWETCAQVMKKQNWTRNMDWFKIRTEARQGCILSLCLFNFYAEYIMRNARLDKAYTGIKIDGRNINNLRYAYDTTLMAES